MSMASIFLGIIYVITAVVVYKAVSGMPTGKVDSVERISQLQSWEYIRSLNKDDNK